MDESVHLPNEVSCSNQRLNGPPILGQNKRITAEYKRVNATSTRRSRSSTIEPVGTGNIDNVTAGAKTVAENGTTLKILKLVCIGLSVSTIISTATFGGMIHNLVSFFYFVQLC